MTGITVVAPLDAQRQRQWGSLGVLSLAMTKTIKPEKEERLLAFHQGNQSIKPEKEATQLIPKRV